MRSAGAAGTSHGIERQAGLKEFAARHLVLKAKAGRVSESWENTRRMLTRAVAFFGAGRSLDSIGVRDVQRFATLLQEQPNGRGGTLGGGSIRHHLAALSNLYRRAAAENAVPANYNPVGALLGKPTAAAAEAHWLSVPDAALLLESVRTYGGGKDGRPLLSCFYELLATLLLTGARG